MSGQRRCGIYFLPVCGVTKMHQFRHPQRAEFSPGAFEVNLATAKLKEIQFVCAKAYQKPKKTQVTMRTIINVPVHPGPYPLQDF